MIIYDELKKDHRTVLGLLDRLVTSAQSPAKVRNDLIDQIRDELIPHSRAEEAILYNSLREIDESRDVVAHSYGEHVMAESMLRLLQIEGKADLEWQTTARKLRAALAHHIDEEESQIFSAAQKVLATPEAEMMGEAFIEMKPKIREQGFMGTTLDMIANMMPARFSESMRNFILPK